MGASISALCCMPHDSQESTISLKERIHRCERFIRTHDIYLRPFIAVRSSRKKVIGSLSDRVTECEHKILEHNSQIESQKAWIMKQDRLLDEQSKLIEEQEEKIRKFSFRLRNLTNKGMYD